MRFRSYTIFLLLAIPLINLHATPEDEQFQQIAQHYIETFLAANPEYATELGDHRFDDRLSDYSAEQRVRELEQAKEAQQQLQAFADLSQLTGANKVDVRLLKDNIDNQIFHIEELKESE
ncbi:MAG: hypothetical protein DMF04_01275, partial [Verrucomicrobia bacterium]